MGTDMFFQGWDGPVRSLVVGTLAYLALLFWLRVSGKRTLSKWNAFDFIVTIALGSTLAAALLNKDVSLVGGVIALGLLVLLQFLITWLAVRFGWVLQLIKAEPTLLFHQGRFCDEAMERQRVARTEVLTAIRQKGFGDLEDIEVVVLETDGSFSVVAADKAGSRSALTDIPSISGGRGPRDQGDKGQRPERDDEGAIDRHARLRDPRP